ncbi:MAG: SRPBCC family protein [Sciscionella sp.]|nr:SRPBCC family protein [Sciscionella sp.]
MDESGWCTFESKASSSADAHTLYRLLVDGANWRDWAGPLIAHSSIERQGIPPNGAGAIRRLGRWPMLVREETVDNKEDRRHCYTIRSGAPVRDYLAEVILNPTENGTDVVWRGRFRPAIAGTAAVIELVFARLIAHLTRRLVAAAESTESRVR